MDACQIEIQGYDSIEQFARNEVLRFGCKQNYEISPTANSQSKPGESLQEI